MPLKRRPARILLVEDNYLDVELALDAFRESRLESHIHVARNGQAALEYLFGQADYQDRQKYPLPDLVLLDLKLPGVDGHEVLQRIKSKPELKRLPVIIMSSSQEWEDISKSYDYGANSYLVKPGSSYSFVDVIRHIDEYWLTLNISPPQIND